MRFNRLFTAALTLASGILVLPFSTYAQDSHEEIVLSAPALPEGEDDEEGDMGAFFNGFGVGASFGLSLYYGDLAKYDVFPKTRDFDEYFRSGWRVYAVRDIKWGLGARLQFQKGTLMGGRKIGEQSPHTSMRNRYHGIDLSVNYSLDRLLFKRSKASDRKIWFDGNLGVGYTWFRAYQYFTETGMVREKYFGYSVPEGTENLTVNVLDDREKMSTTITVPLGLTMGYRLNYKTDITFTVSQVSVMSDEFDARERSWSARDKYGFFGFGLKFNFNRSEDDYPEKKERNRNNNTTSDAGNAGAGAAGAGTPNDIAVGDDFRSNRTLRLKRRNRNRNNGSDDELLNVRLKMFEIQMKLFEMEYLLKDF